MNKSYSWNNYVIGIGGVLTIFSWVYMILSIRGVISNSSFSIVAILFVLIGTPLIIGYWFVDMRNRKLRRLAKDFGLGFEKLTVSSGTQEFPTNRISGVINGSAIVIEDHQKLYGSAGRHVASRKTLFLINQVEQATPSSWNGYKSVRGIRKQLISIRG